MKLYLRQKKSWFNDQNFHIEDEDGKRVYDLKFSALIAKKIKIMDADKKQVAEIRQELKSLMPRYSVYIGDEKLLEVKKDLKLLGVRYNLDGLEWEMKNRLMLHDYEVYQGSRRVLEVQPIRRFSRLSCEITVDDPADMLKAAALVVAIECGIEEIHVDKKDD